MKINEFYEPGLFDVEKALARFRQRAGLSNAETDLSAESSDGHQVRWWTLSTVAAIVIGVVLTLWWQSRSVEYLAYDTVQTFILPDSTKAILSHGATLRYRQHRHFREVNMTGKSYFEVSPDPSNPFEIIAGEAFIRVLGTCFQVSQNDSVSRVDVISGKVLFSSQEDRPSRKDGIVDANDGNLVLSGGMSARLASGNNVPKIIEAEQINPAAWATGEFVYEYAPLMQVLEELSEYYGVKLSIVPACLVGVGVGSKSYEESSIQKRVTATFSASLGLSGIVYLLEQAMGVSIQQGE